MYPDITSIFTERLLLELLVSAGMLLTLFIAIWAIAFYRLSVRIWTLIIAFVLGGFAWAYGQFFVLNIIAWAVFLPISFLVNIPHCRSKCFTRMVLRKFNSMLPALSETEKQALNAGDVGWEKEIFSGAPDWDKLYSIPEPTLTTEELAFINNQVEVLCSMIDDWKLTQPPHKIPEPVLNYIKKEKFFGIIIDKQYGGLGFSSLAHSTIVTKIASRSYSVAVTVMVPNSLGPAEFLQHYGTSEQKEKYLPKLADGCEVPCFALTAPNAGSDAAAITDTGVISEHEYEGKKVLGLRLNWSKRYITLAPIATLLGIAVRVQDPDHFFGHTVDLGITFCLVPTHLPGVQIGDRHMAMNMAFMNGPTCGKDVFIPLENIIGGPESIGRGWEMMMNSLAVGRGISLPAVSSATAKLCFLTTGAYAKVREQFNMPIGEFEGVQEALTRIGGYTYLCEATRLLTVSTIDTGVKPAIASAITKYHLTELNRKIINDAMDVHGGRGLIMGEKNYLAQMYIAAPISITVEGANILTRNLIIFGQGAVRCHPYILKEMEAASIKNELERLANFDHLLFEHMGYLLSNIARALLYGLTCGRFIRPKEKGFLRPYMKAITRMCRAYAVVADVSMITLGGKLKRRELLSARLGDMLSHLYMASAVIKYFNDNGQDAQDEPFVSWAIKTCLYEFQQSFIQLVNNLPSCFVGWIIRLTTFPFGLCYGRPRDKVSTVIANALLKQSSLRSRLTQHCYQGDKDKDAVAAMEYAFQSVLASEEANNKLQKSYKVGTIDRNKPFDEQLDAALQVGVLTMKEREQLQEAYQLQQEAIQVDSVPQKTSTRKGSDEEID